jgi:hypothetical protein
MCLDGVLHSQAAPSDLLGLVFPLRMLRTNAIQRFEV